MDSEKFLVHVAEWPTPELPGSVCNASSRWLRPFQQDLKAVKGEKLRDRKTRHKAFSLTSG